MVTGCAPSQPDTSEFTKQVEVLTKRMEELEIRPRNASSSDVLANVQVDNANAIGIFADATDVKAAGRNLLIGFGIRNYTSGQPAEATPRLNVYMNYYTAKRLEAALALSVQRHASVFGEVQADELLEYLRSNNNTQTVYVNFVRLTGSPEELIVDLGLNPQPVGVPADPIPASHTVIMDYPTGNSLLRQVRTLVTQYEAANGPIETDIEKRVTN
jgi:hypothetical protein